MVNVFYWNRGNEEKRGINAKFYYHPQCWVAHGLDYLKMNPYVPYTRHKETKLTEDEMRTRHLLLRKKAKIDQRRRGLNPSRFDYGLVMAQLDTRVAELMVEIAQVGGIPKKWMM